MIKLCINMQCYSEDRFVENPPVRCFVFRLKGDAIDCQQQNKSVCLSKTGRVQFFATRAVIIIFLSMLLYSETLCFYVHLIVIDSDSSALATDR